MSARAAAAPGRRPPAAPIIVLDLPDEAATEALGRILAGVLETGDLVALSGAIGAGKTSLARAILRASLGDPALDVPSPTFTLVQTYEGPSGPLVHADFYRIAGAGELVELGFDELQAGSAVLVEWPERAPEALGPERLDILLEAAPAGSRRATLSGSGPLAARFARVHATNALIGKAGWSDARRDPMQGDASTRGYERLARPSGETAVLMISPPRPDGPPVRRGKPYSAIARLAESVHAFAAMDRGLAAEGLSAPTILAEDLEAGLLLLEDLGSEPVVDADGPIPDRYAEATRLLAALHARALPATLPLADEAAYTIPPYDIDALLIEVDLLLDWYLPFVAGVKPSGSVKAEFGHVWREVLADVVAGPKTWTLRDYHSPNLIWLPDRQGIRRVGLLDFQDAVLGPPAYDVASLLQDARVTVPPELELRLLGIYAGERKARDPAFDMSAFATAYSLMGAQRATKILGIFARLDRRDGKPQYLAHLPRIRAYLARCLAHPGLIRLRAWFQYHVPGDILPAPETHLAGSAPDPSPAGEGRAALQAQAGAGLRPSDQQPTPPGSASPSPPSPAGEVSLPAAMVLAAGLGSRMRPITDTLPKPLVSVGGRTLIDHALDRLAAAGIRDVVVNVHHLADRIETHLAERDDLAVTISDERDVLLETGGGIRRALPLLGDPFLVMNSDSLWTEPGQPNLPRLLAAWEPDRMDILLLLAPRAASVGYDGRGDFTMDEAGRLARRPPDGEAPFVYAGVGVLKAGLFADAPDGAFSLNRLFDGALAEGRLFGLPLEGEWLHVGTPEAVAEAESRLATGPAAATEG